MKRSEVIKKIMGLYDLEISNFPKHNPSDIFAENLLCHLEDMGMQPPNIKYKQLFPESTLVGEFEDPWFVIWEPEDE